MREWLCPSCYGTNCTSPLFHTPTLTGRYIARYMARPIATLLYVYMYTYSRAPLSPFHVGKVALDDEDSGVCVLGGGGGGDACG